MVPRRNSAAGEQGTPADLSRLSHSEMDHRERHHGPREDSQYQPTRKYPIAIPQLPNVPGKSRHGAGPLRVLFDRAVKLRRICRFGGKLGDSIKSLVCHGADVTTTN